MQLQVFAKSFPATALAAIAFFAAHPARAALPSGFVELEAIQGDGTAAYIRTDYVPNPLTDRLEMKFRCDTSKSAAFFCARNTTTATADSWTLFYLANASPILRFDYSASQTSQNTSLSSMQVVELSVASNVVTFADGSTLTANVPCDPAFVQAGSPMFLFASTVDGDTANGNYAKHILYSFKVYRGGLLIHDYVPAKRSSDGKVGLCDAVTGDFFTNANSSGAFSPIYRLYHIPGSQDAGGTSSLSGLASGSTYPLGWSDSTNSAARIRNGIVGAYEKYYFWSPNRAAPFHYLRTPNNASYATPATSEIIILPKSYVHFFNKSCGTGTDGTMATLTFNNTTLGEGSLFVFQCNQNGRYTYYTEVGGSFDIGENAALTLVSNGGAGGSDTPCGVAKLTATVRGKGRIESKLVNGSTATSASTRKFNQSISGNLSGFTGDLVVYRANLTYPGDLIHELVNANSIPADPAPGETAYVVVTNKAVLQVDQDWDSGENRIWNFGDSGVPTINVAAGKTVTIRGELLGSIGFNKTGSGTLVLAHPRAQGVTLSGTATFTAAQLAAYQADCNSDVAVVAPGLQRIAPGEAATPEIVASNVTQGVRLVLGTDYTVAYANNDRSGTATATVTGIGDYVGLSRSVDFAVMPSVQVNTDLSGDTSWVTYGDVEILSGATLDLKGHTLTLASLSGSGTVTDSVGGGRLVMDIPAGKTITIVTSLTGALKLVKQGAGILVASKAGQTYTGGTDVLGGILRTGGGNATDGWLGPNTSTTTCHVYVGPNGILDPAGSSAWGYHKVALDGGMVSNTVARTGTGSVCFNPTLSTTGNVSLVTMDEYSWTSAGGDLNGSTLTIENYNYKTCYPGNWRWSNGTIHLKTGGWVKASRNALDVRSCDLRQTGAALGVANAILVRDYYCSYGGDYYEGTAALSVYGTFTPASTYFYGCTMQDGSAIDLSGKSGAWSTTSPNGTNHKGLKTVAFAAGANVTVRLGAREVASGDKVVSWSSAPNATFSFDGVYAPVPAVVKTDGLYMGYREFAVMPIPAQTISGHVPSRPAIVVTNTVAGIQLVEGIDYSVVYTDNIHSGTATATITGLGIYDGMSYTTTFELTELITETDFSKRIAFTPGEGKVPTPVDGLPVLVRLSAARQPGFDPSECGQVDTDVRFVLEDGTFLPFEVDHWDTNGESTVWVRLPTLASDTRFYFYYGMHDGAEVPASPAATTVWTGYVGVWHMNSASGSVPDATGHGLTATASGANASADCVGISTAGAKSPVCRRLASVKDNKSYLLIPNYNSYGLGGNFVISGWFKNIAAYASYSARLFVRKDNYADGNGFDVEQLNSSDVTQTRTTLNCRGAGSTLYFRPTIPDLVNNWLSLAMSYEGTTLRAYVNGTAASSGTITAATDNGKQLAIGNQIAGTTYNFIGYVDEVRLSGPFRTAAYLAAEYATMADGDYLSSGPPEVISAALSIDEIPAQYYRGATVVPAVVVRDGDGNELSEGTDYTLAFEANAAPGFASVTATGVGTFAGDEVSRSFTILEGVDFGEIAPLVAANGVAVEPPVEATDAETGVALTNGVDYVLSYSGNTTIGSSTVTVSGLGRYAGLERTIPFEVLRLSPNKGLPAEYRQVAYIKGDGTAARILTDYIPAPQADEVETAVELDSLSGYAIFLRSCGSAWNVNAYQAYYNPQNYLNVGYYTSNVSRCSGEFKSGVQYCVTAARNVFSVAGGGIVDSYAFEPVPRFTKGGNKAMLFAAYSNGTGSNLGCYSDHKLYWLTVRRDGALYRDFVPCVRRSDGAVGLYERASGIFYGNVNTSGAFTAGEGATGLQALPPGTFDYTGSAVQPAISVVDAATGAAIPPSDFTVAYSGNIAPGMGIATVTGKAGTAYAGMTCEVAFGIGCILHVTGYSLETEGDGLSWQSPMSLTNAIVAADSFAGGASIWLVSGTYTLGESVNVYAYTPFALLGGFAGTETSPDERAPGGLSTINGSNAYQVRVENHAEARIDRIDFRYCSGRCLVKVGPGDMEVSECSFYNPANVAQAGRGIYASGTAGATRLSVVDCTFDQCKANGAGGGVYLQNLARAQFDRCVFTRCGDIAGETASSVQDYQALATGSTGAALYSKDAPVTLRGCRFVANQPCNGVPNSSGQCTTEDASRGGTVYLYGNCDGSAISNCIFACNSGFRQWYTSDYSGFMGGALVVRLENKARTVDVVNCTFAYNLARGPNSPGGLNVHSGTVNLKNSIVYANRHGNDTGGGNPPASSPANDIFVQGNGVLNLSWTLMTTNSTTYIDKASSGVVNYGDGMIYGRDPLLVTTSGTVGGWINTGDTPAYRFKSASMSSRLAVNIHLRGARGYVDETTGDFVKTYASEVSVSPGVDGGDPADDFHNEADIEKYWHGRRVNLGAYGNTQWATLTLRPGGVFRLR